MSSKIFGIIQAPLEHIYEIEIKQPALLPFSTKYGQNGRLKGIRGYFNDVGENGTIGISEDYCTKKGRLASTYAHELGHAATWQNNPGYYGTKYEFKNQMDYMMEIALGEGIASDFCYRGLEILAVDGYISIATAAKEASMSMLNLWIQPRYDIGRKIVSHFKKRGVSVKRLILEPEEFRGEISKIFSKEMKSAYNFLFMQFLGF